MKHFRGFRKIFCFLYLLLLVISCTVQNTSSGYENATISWYGDKFHGRLTASGERYNMRKATAAHKTLPFGTKVEIFNPENGKKIIVRITDRGPFVPDRVFDLSKGAFRKISDLDKGVITIKYRIIR